MSATVQKPTERGSTMKPSVKPNAWSKPLQAKPTAKPIPPPQIIPNDTASTTTPSPPSNNSTPLPPPNLIALRERFLLCVVQLTGQKVSITLDTGVTYTGILHTATPFDSMRPEERCKYVLKAATGGDLAPGSTVIVDMNTVVQLHVPSCRMEKDGSGNNNFLDGEIAKPAGNAVGELVQADAAWTKSNTTNASSSSSYRLGDSIAGWDQFKANEKLFNVKGGYDESVYTTVLDPSQMSESEKSKAAKIAKEILTTPSNNFHVAEERNQVTSIDFDEEDRYSGVLKAPPPKLNYAQAAAASKSVAAAAAEPIAEETVETPAKAEPGTSKPEGEDVSEAKKKSEKVADAEDDGNEEASSKSTDAPKSKLDPNATEFSFSLAAKPFVPHQPPPPPPPAAYMTPQPYAIDPNTGMPVAIMPQMPMQPGMIHPMMNPMHYAMSYQRYPEPMMLQPPPPPNTNGATPPGPNSGEDQPPPPPPQDSSSTDSNNAPTNHQLQPQQNQQQHPPVQHMPVHFQPYYPAVHHHPSGPPQQFVHHPNMRFPGARPPFMYYNDDRGRGGGRARNGRGRGRGRGSRGRGRHTPPPPEDTES